MVTKVITASDPRCAHDPKLWAAIGALEEETGTAKAWISAMTRAL